MNEKKGGYGSSSKLVTKLSPPPRTVGDTTEVERLRARIHEAVDECQRRYASMQSDYERLVALHREVMRRHGEDQIAKGENPICGISTYGVAITAVIAQERDEALATIARVKALLAVDPCRNVNPAKLRAALKAPSRGETDDDD